jgi:hypothetical protein
VPPATLRDGIYIVSVVGFCGRLGGCSACTGVWPSCRRNCRAVRKVLPCLRAVLQATCFGVVMIMVIITSTLNFLFDTVESIATNNARVLHTLEVSSLCDMHGRRVVGVTLPAGACVSLSPQTSCITFFTAELCLRFVVCPSRRQLIREPVFWVDIVAVIPYYLELGLPATVRPAFLCPARYAVLCSSPLQLLMASLVQRCVHCAAAEWCLWCERHPHHPPCSSRSCDQDDSLFVVAEGVLPGTHASGSERCDALR